MGNQKDLFEGAVVDVKEKQGKSEGIVQDGSGGGEPPARFAPMSGEFGDALPLGVALGVALLGNVKRVTAGDAAAAAV